MMPKPEPVFEILQHEDRAPRPPAITVLSDAEFIKGYRAPEYLIPEWRLQRGLFYSCTAMTGHGKTAVALTEAVTLATLGRRVIYLAGENPDDLRGRRLLMLDRMQCESPPTLSFIAGTFNLQRSLPDIDKAVHLQNGADLFVVDTSPAFLVASGFTDESDNIQTVHWANQLRSLTKLQGCPAVLALCHPTKWATKDNLLPRGGGAFLAEVDGNYTLLASPDRKSTELAWLGKFRGPSFDPISYALDIGTCTGLVDAHGDHMPSVWAYRISAATAEAIAEQAFSDQENLLIVLAEAPRSSQRKLAEILGWRTSSDAPHASKVNRTLQLLKAEGFVRETMGKYQLTKDGKTEAERIKGTTE